MKELKFNNRDAAGRLKSLVIKCDESDMDIVKDMYDAFCAGDRYTVYIDGKRQ